LLCLFAAPPAGAKTDPSVPPKVAEAAQKAKTRLSLGLRTDAIRLRAFSEAISKEPPDARAMEKGAFPPVIRPLREHLSELKERTSLYPGAIDDLREKSYGAENLAEFIAEDESHRLRLIDALDILAGRIERLLYDLEAKGFGPPPGGPPSERAARAKEHPVEGWLPGAVEALEGFSEYGESEAVIEDGVQSRVAFKNGRELIVRGDGMIVEKYPDGTLVQRGLIRPSAQQALMYKKGTADIEILWGSSKTDELIGKRQTIDFDSGEKSVEPIFGIEGNAKFTLGPIDALVFGWLAPAFTAGYGANEVKNSVRAGVKETVYDAGKVDGIESPFWRAAAEFGLDVAMSKPLNSLLDFGPGLPGWVSSLVGAGREGNRGKQMLTDLKTLFTVDDSELREGATYRLTKNTLRLGKKMLGMGADPEPEPETKLALDQGALASSG
jgi:hypothetical protein